MCEQFIVFGEDEFWLELYHIFLGIELARDSNIFLTYSTAHSIVRHCYEVVLATMLKIFIQNSNF